MSLQIKYMVFSFIERTLSLFKFFKARFQYRCSLYNLKHIAIYCHMTNAAIIIMAINNAFSYN